MSVKLFDDRSNQSIYFSGLHALQTKMNQKSNEGILCALKSKSLIRILPRHQLQYIASTIWLNWFLPYAGSWSIHYCRRATTLAPRHIYSASVSSCGGLCHSSQRQKREQRERKSDKWFEILSQFTVRSFLNENQLLLDVFSVQKQLESVCVIFYVRRRKLSFGLSVVGTQYSI
jgi:hypothetical protein